MDGVAGDLRPQIEIEFFETGFLCLQPAVIDALRHRKQHEQHCRETNAIDGRDLFRKQVRYGYKEQNECRDDQADGPLLTPQVDIQRGLVFLIVAAEAEHQHSQRLHEEAPHDAESVGFTQQIHVAAAAENRGDL